MQLEWSRWLSGMTVFKEQQGMLWIFCVVLYVILWQKGSLKKYSLFMVSLLLGLLVVFPATAIVLLKIFTPFYDWKDLQLLWPITLLMAFGGVEAVFFLKDRDIPEMHIGKSVKVVISIGCVVTLLFVATGFRGLTSRMAANENGVPAETAEVFDALYEVVGDRHMILAAPGRMLQYARLYETEWQTLYGRDLWDGKAASYINSGYGVEYEYYSLLEKNTLLPEEHLALTDLMNKELVDCAIVPIYWPGEMGPMPGYTVMDLNDYYSAIIKKDLIIE